MHFADEAAFTADLAAKLSQSLRLLQKQDVLVGSEPLRCQHLPAGMVDQNNGAFQLEHMMMDEPLLVVVPVTLPVLRYGIGYREFLVFPQRDKLFHVSHIVLAGVAGIILT